MFGLSILITPIYYIVVYPLKLFYMHGPIWRGAEATDACAQLTSVGSSFWSDPAHPDRLEQCASIVDRQFTSFAITIATVIYFSVVASVLIWSVCRCCFIAPIMRETKRLIVAGIREAREGGAGT